MAHFAKLDENNVVVHVSVVDNWNVVDGQGNEVEQIGIDYLKQIHGGNTTWVQTSYNGNMRKNYAGIGYTYDAGRDAFIPSKPFNSWLLNEDTCQWEAPVPLPEDAGTGEPPKMYTWNEETTSWDEVVIEE